MYRCVRHQAIAELNQQLNIWQSKKFALQFLRLIRKKKHSRTTSCIKTFIFQLQDKSSILE